MDLSIDHVSKSFPGVRALDDITFHVRAGEIHALMGENGAGKSTLIKIVTGVYKPELRTPSARRSAGGIRFAA